MYRLLTTHLCLYVRCSSTSRSTNFRCFAEHLLLLQGHTVFAGSITIFLIVEDGIGVVNQHLVLLGWGEQLSWIKKRHKSSYHNLEKQHRHWTKCHQVTTTNIVQKHNLCRFCVSAQVIDGLSPPPLKEFITLCSHNARTTKMLDLWWTHG